MITVTVPIHYKQTKKKTVLVALNWYRNVHYNTNDNVKKFYKGIVRDFVEGDPILDNTIHVHYKIFYKRKGTDGGNVRSVIEKYVLDAIKASGHIPEDNAEIIVTSSDEYHQDKKYPRAEITLFDKVTDTKELQETLLNIIL